MKEAVKCGLLLVALSLYWGIRSQGQPGMQLQPVREQEFVGHLEAGDYYRVCRLDSKGNLFLRTRKDVVQKIPVDGSDEYQVNFRTQVQIPLGIHDMAVGLDDVLYVVGVDLAGTATVVYKILPGENTPVLFEMIPGVDPCRCAVATDLSLHIVSFETGWINDMRDGRFDPRTVTFDHSTRSVLDVSVRRLSPNGRGHSGYAPLRLPIDPHELRSATRDLCDNLFAVDRDGGTHVLDAQSGSCHCYSVDGVALGDAKLELNRSQNDGRTLVLQMVSLGGGYFAYNVVYVDSNNMVKSSDFVVAKHGTDNQRRIEPKGNLEPYQLDAHPASDELLQYWFIKDRILTQTYMISDLVKE